MKDLVIIGAGGFAREVKFLIDDINRVEERYNFLGYIVSSLENVGEYDSKDEILGDYSWIAEYGKPLAVSIGIGTPATRIKIGNELIEKFDNLEFPNLIHPNVIYDKTNCTFGKGNIVCASNVFTVNVEIKNFALINLCCTIGHEAVIGDGCVLNPTVNISGGVTLENGVLVGTGSQVLQYLTIGSGSTVGANACVTKNVPQNTVVVGTPAKPLNLKS